MKKEENLEQIAKTDEVKVADEKAYQASENAQQNETLEKEVKENRKQEFFRFIKFLLFSISAGVIQFGSFTLMTEAFGWDSFWGPHIISVVLSVIWNFTFNRKFTFKSANNVPIAMTLVLAYYVVFTPASAFGGQALENAGWNGLLVEALMMIINFVTEFFYQRYVVFRSSINTNSLAKAKINKALELLQEGGFVKSNLTAKMQKAVLQENTIEKIYKKKEN